MKKTAILLFIFSVVSAYSQPNEDFVFYPLAVVETISDADELKSLTKADKLNKKDFFFTEKYKDHNGLFFIKKENDKWIVFNFELGLNFGANTSVKNIKEENRRFVSIQLSRSPSGMCSSTYGIIVLLDITRNEEISFFNLNEQICYDYQGENVVARESKCKATFSIKGDVLKITSTKKPDDGLYCAESGTYHYENGKFIRQK